MHPEHKAQHPQSTSPQKENSERAEILKPNKEANPIILPAHQRSERGAGEGEDQEEEVLGWGCSEIGR